MADPATTQKDIGLAKQLLADLEAAGAAPEPVTAAAPTWTMGAPARHPDGRLGVIASLQRDGNVRLQIGPAVTEWLSRGEVRPT